MAIGKSGGKGGGLLDAVSKNLRNKTRTPRRLPGVFGVAQGAVLDAKYAQHAMDKYDQQMGSMGGGGGGGGGGRGGGFRFGGGYDPEKARQEALVKQRAMVEELYTQQVGRMGTQRDEAMAVLPGYLNEAMGRLKTINGQNVQAGRHARDMIGRDTRSAQGQIRGATKALRGDLGAQGVDASALLGAGQMYQADAGARGAASNNFNSRLDAIMALQYGDQRAGSTQIHQGAQANTQNNYQQALAELQRQRTQQLMGLV